MIRIILAIMLIAFAFFGMMFGVHPVWCVPSLFTAMVLISWVCVNKVEDEPENFRI